VTHNLELPVAPKIDITLSKNADDSTVTLQSSKLARNVLLLFGDLEAQTSDNHFDLLPGEVVTVRVKSPATLEQLRAAMKTESLTEAFNSN